MSPGEEAKQQGEMGRGTLTESRPWQVPGGEQQRGQGGGGSAEAPSWGGHPVLISGVLASGSQSALPLPSELPSASSSGCKTPQACSWAQLKVPGGCHWSVAVGLTVCAPTLCC